MQLGYLRKSGEVWFLKNAVGWFTVAMSCIGLGLPFAVLAWALTEGWTQALLTGSLVALVLFGIYALSRGALTRVDFGATEIEPPTGERFPFSDVRRLRVDSVTEFNGEAHETWYRLWAETKGQGPLRIATTWRRTSLHRAAKELSERIGAPLVDKSN